jgi:hypothetical protein
MISQIILLLMKKLVIVIIYNDRCEIKAPTIKYNRLFIIINFMSTDDVIKIIRNEIPDYSFNDSNIFIKTRSHWLDIFQKINKEINKNDILLIKIFKYIFVDTNISFITILALIMSSCSLCLTNLEYNNTTQLYEDLLIKYEILNNDKLDIENNYNSILSKLSNERHINRELIKKYDALNEEKSNIENEKNMLIEELDTLKNVKKMLQVILDTCYYN